MEELIKEMEKLGYRMCNNCIPTYSFGLEGIDEYGEFLTRIYIFSDGFYKEVIDKKSGDFKNDVAVAIEETEIIYKIMKLLRGDK